MKGDEVTLISQAIDGVCIVEANGNRFSCRIEQLGDVKPIEEVKVDDEFNLF